MSERTDVDIHFSTGWMLASSFSPAYAGKTGITFCKLFICCTWPTMFYLWYFWFRKMFPTPHRREHCTVYPIVLFPTIFIQILIFWATKKQAVHVNCSSLQAVCSPSMCCHSWCYFSPLSYLRTLFSLFASSSTYIDSLKRSFFTWWLPACFSAPHHSSHTTYGGHHTTASARIHVSGKARHLCLHSRNCTYQTSSCIV